MNPHERAVVFDCDGDRLVGILSEPPQARSDLGIVIIVGGPQYRVGSHRQFVHLSRTLASKGWPVFRFDYRGMGDSEGEIRTFQDIDVDIRASIDAFIASTPTVHRVVLWGLCDGASAAMIYSPSDARVAGMVLANPWIRHPSTEAATKVKHYYLKRLFSSDLWRRLFRGKVDVWAAAREVGNLIHRIAIAPTKSFTERDFQERMATGWECFHGPSLVLLSGRDLTAAEFLEKSNADVRWAKLHNLPRIKFSMIPNADHTFASGAIKDRVGDDTAGWLMRTPTI